MRCEAATLEISARLDGARDARLDAQLDDHLASCAECRAFEARARRLRERVRLQPADEVPDLVAPIMEKVRTAPQSRSWVRPAVTFLAGAAASALVLGGIPLVRPGVPAALAKEIPQLVAEASRRVESYRATFDITESNFLPDVPQRRFTSTIEFASPERFRAQVTDETRYPSGRWPRNDTTLAVDGSRWEVSGPATCPREALPVCATGRRETRSVRGREPFDGETPLPSDIVLPVRTLADADRVIVGGSSRILGRRTVAVGLAYRDAAPLFAHMQAAGIWRPFFPLDRVTVYLDRETMLPLVYEVRASRSAERSWWVDQNALPDEDDGAILLSAEARSLDLHASAPRITFAPGGTDAGFRDRPLGSEPLIPRKLLGLRPHRSGHFARGRPGEIALSYARGLAWLKIRQTKTWDEPTLFGNISSLASPVSVGRGVAYAEPATESFGRRLSIHTGEWDVFLESNLPFSDLLTVAASLPIIGAEVPRSWLVRTWPGGIVREQVSSLDRARAEAPYLLVPTSLPAEYRPTINLVRAGDERGVTLYYRRDMEPDGIGVRIHAAPAQALPPPLEPDTYAVRVNASVGRYSPARSELEWITDGIYRSVAAQGFDAGRLVDIAESLEPVER